MMTENDNEMYLEVAQLTFLGFHLEILCVFWSVTLVPKDLNQRK
jgi:hypothetical protein